MKAKRLVRVIAVCAIAIVGFLIFRNPSSSGPALVFKGYVVSETSARVHAKLELQNTTDRSVWLCYSGPEFPLSPPFLNRPVAVLPKQTNIPDTNVFSVKVGSFLMSGEEVLPGNCVSLEFPIHAGEPAELAGITYYVGTFANGNDFVSRFWVPLLDGRAGWKEKAVFYWQRFRDNLKSPQSHEVWCPEPLSYSTAESSSVTK